MRDWNSDTPGDHRVADAVRAAVESGIPLRIVGRGTWHGVGDDTPEATPLSLADDTGVVEYRPDDLTITVRAGTTLAELDDALHAHNQWLPLDPLGSGEGTIGATVATCSYGPLAALFGTPRDQVLGLTVVTGLGHVIHPGGRVVKNVAGFDLTRLMIGAWGTLGVITQVTLRVRARGMNPDAYEHMRRPLPAEYGYREPVVVHPALSAALRRRFDPANVLNRGVMRVAPVGDEPVGDA